MYIYAVFSRNTSFGSDGFIFVHHLRWLEVQHLATTSTVKSAKVAERCSGITCCISVKFNHLQDASGCSVEHSKYVEAMAAHGDNLKNHPGDTCQVMVSRSEDSGS